jgi:hypothetical protein
MAQIFEFHERLRSTNRPTAPRLTPSWKAKAMGLPLSVEDKREKTSDGLLSSENLKKEKGGNHLLGRYIRCWTENREE